MAGYKIKDLEILTGIKAHTIRMWEKRYGILAPQRTVTQIRTYSDDDLILLLNVSLLNKNGYKISRIAQMNSSLIIQTSKQVQSQDIVNSSIEQFIVAVVKLDEHLFQKTFQELIQKSPLTEVFSDSIIPFLRRIGVMWLVGTINPAQEHFISNLIRQKIIAAIDSLPIPDQKKPVVLLHLPEHEWHEISLLIYHYQLRFQGTNSIYLGQALPYDSLLKTIQVLHPTTIISSWLTAVDPQEILDYFHNIQKDTQGINLYAGGYQIDQIEKLLPKTVKRIEMPSDLEVLL
ncbi:MerR family transcriptional regulator [Fluviicola taffensis]|uniref:Regulatory protein MerR n=1 Tax=Fluviicola taffensis (strain DSM 16823 / NCIMB 13979 / RW262) TaxID=755732 RepID=F2IK34_FLUTR|nr:MerR family transcriptional regulator [Fluviicola taffensis]AEA42933.1 regulatory protein MerR [Fluviicola taffensis DSM 16823]